MVSGHRPIQIRARETHDALVELMAACLDRQKCEGARIATAAPTRRASAINLSHYLAMRERDRRPLQNELIELGLSSLGRLEPAVLHALTLSRHAAARLIDPPLAGPEPEPVELSIPEGRALLDRQTESLLGPRPGSRMTRIMVTAPAESADNRGVFMRACLDRGVNAIRINTTQDEPTVWRTMLAALREAERDADRHALAFADLGGPKIRVARLKKKGRDREELRLRVGDEMLLHRHDPATDIPDAEPTPTLWCDKPEALFALREGHAVWFDDGKLGARVEQILGDTARLRVFYAKPSGQRLRLNKGLNVPDSRLDAPSLTEDDLRTMEALADDVDAFCLSFVNRAEDVNGFIDRLAARTDRPVGVVLKIETRDGFERLPELLFALMRAPRAGVMIARGDLAVEIGFERLAEVQEEILWLCEAAHTPVIWATDVLSNLAKRGAPSRAEITDAAMAQRAECVMLNKGPEILRAVSVLGDILERMEAHQRKKMATLRPLAIARRAAP